MSADDDAYEVTAQDWRDLGFRIEGHEPFFPRPDFAELCETLARIGPTHKARRRRKPAIAALIKRAEKSGHRVTSVTTTPDGTTLTFGEGESTADNEVENWFSKQRRHADQR